ncbi:hypothetical protein LJR030_003150 [Rhizobium sp. LjRoot30]|uniref:hypothetical protein n=1 Tax=Rhizobium sp. LjRoot30 TaxID=3342320 RepID=UPI003ED09696
MTEPIKRPRVSTTIEGRREAAEVTTVVALESIDIEKKAREEKTARLRALREQALAEPKQI